MSKVCKAGDYGNQYYGFVLSDINAAQYLVYYTCPSSQRA